MTPLIILSLFGIAMLVPTFSGDDTDDTPDLPNEPVDEPVVEVPAVETPIIETPVIETPTIETPAVVTPAPKVAPLNGTIAADTLTTATAQIVNGYSGADALTAEDGAATPRLMATAAMIYSTSAAIWPPSVAAKAMTLSTTPATVSTLELMVARATTP